jgi:hypothetical protein
MAYISGGHDRVREEKYTLPECKRIITDLYNFLIANDEIIFESELRQEAQRAGLVKASTIRYIQSCKYNNSKELASLFIDIAEVLEARCAKTRAMYPNISALALKNKHGWVDKNETTQNTTVTMMGTVKVDGKPFKVDL